MRRLVAPLLAAALFAGALSSQSEHKKTGRKATPPPPAPAIKLDQPPGLYALIETSMGRIVCRLFPDKTPETVKNFVDLANGTKRWWDEKKKAWTQGRYFDGLTFHRVIPDFMIQGGDQLGTGRGNVGYTFKDEFTHDLRFEKPGRLAMANAGPETNGAQFFITVAPTPHLNDHHTIFGEVVEGQDVADAISQVPRDSENKPTTPVVMTKVMIVEVKPSPPGQ